MTGRSKSGPTPVLRARPEPHRHVYAVPATGVIEVDGKRVKARDGIAFTGGSKVVFKAIEGPAEIVLTDTL